MAPRPPSGLTVLPFRPPDAPALALLFRASRREAMPWLAEPHDLESTVSFLRDVVPARCEVLVARDGTGAPVGFIAFGGGEVEHLYVAPGCQGAGVGSRLLALAMAGGGPLELRVFQRNAPARAFYERHGFRLVALGDGVDNEEREPDARYRWEPAEPRGGG